MTNSFKIHRHIPEPPLVGDIEIHVTTQTLCAILYGLEGAYGDRDEDFLFFQEVWKEAFGKGWGKVE
jgi:hypothetical protein